MLSASRMHAEKARFSSPIAFRVDAINSSCFSIVGDGTIVTTGEYRCVLVCVCVCVFVLREQRVQQKRLINFPTREGPPCVRAHHAAIDLC